MPVISPKMIKTSPTIPKKSEPLPNLKARFQSLYVVDDETQSMLQESFRQHKKYKEMQSIITNMNNHIGTYFQQTKKKSPVKPTKSKILPLLDS